MAFTYTYTNLKDSIFDAALDADISSAITVRDLINRAARTVTLDLDLRSCRRRAALASKVFDDAFAYTCPTDLKGYGIIDIIPQGERRLDTRWKLTTTEQFDRKKSVRNGWVAVQDDDSARKLFLDMDVDDTVQVVANLDSLTEDGTWTTFSAGSTNVAANSENLIQGGGSIGYDLVSGTTTAGIVNSTLTQFDISDFDNTGSAFVWAYVNSTTDLTNFILRIGNDASNYHSMTVTTAADGNAFVAGWNLLRFDLSGKTTTGTVTADECDYVAIYMTKASGKEDDGYAFDFLTLHTGQYHDVFYYTKYAWENSGGTFIENSTADTDKIHADTDELELYTLKGKEFAAAEMKDWAAVKYYAERYAEARTKYVRRYPSEAIKRESNYY